MDYLSFPSPFEFFFLLVSSKRFSDSGDNNPPTFPFGFFFISFIEKENLPHTPGLLFSLRKGKVSSVENTEGWSGQGNREQDGGRHAQQAKRIPKTERTTFVIIARYFIENLRTDSVFSCFFFPRITKARHISIFSCFVFVSGVRGRRVNSEVIELL